MPVFVIYGFFGASLSSINTNHAHVVNRWCCSVSSGYFCHLPVLISFEPKKIMPRKTKIELNR